MRAFVMWLRHVIPRTVFAFVPQLARPEDEWAKRILPSAEYRLYLSMDVRDRAHGCRVARRLSELSDTSPELIRAALLHDVGKSVTAYRAWQRITFHLWAPGANRLSPLGGFGPGADVLASHPRLGAELLRDAGGDERVAQLIERHHEPNGDAEAELLRRIEEVH